MVTEVTQLFKAAVDQAEAEKMNCSLMDVDSVNKSPLAVFLTNVFSLKLELLKLNRAAKINSGLLQKPYFLKKLYFEEAFTIGFLPLNSFVWYQIMCHRYCQSILQTLPVFCLSAQRSHFQGLQRIKKHFFLPSIQFRSPPQGLFKPCLLLNSK